MMDTPALSTPRLVVILDDGATFEIQTDNRDMIAFDRTRQKHKWPAAQDAPATWVTFLAWTHLRREQQIPASMTWELFAQEHCLQARALETDEDDEATPTQPGPEPG